MDQGWRGVCVCVRFLGLLEQIATDRASSRHHFFPSSGGQTSRIKASTASEGSREASFAAPSGFWWWLLAFLGLRQHRFGLCLRPHGAFSPLCLCLLFCLSSFLSLGRAPVFRFRIYLGNPGWSPVISHWKL